MTKPKQKTVPKVEALTSVVKDASYLEEIVEDIIAPESRTTVTIEEASAAKRRADNSFMKRQIKNMAKKMKEDERVTVTPSAGLSQFLGNTFTFLLNGFPITVAINGRPQQFPKFIAEVVERKLREALDANSPKDVTKRITV